MSGEKCVLAYSGGLDTSALVPYMKEKYGYDIVAVLIDVGRMKDVEGLRQRALTAGAVESIVVDAKEEFLREFAFPALQANALYEGKYPLHSASVATIDRQEDGRGGAAEGCRCGGPRVHGEGQRPGAHRCFGAVS